MAISQRIALSIICLLIAIPAFAEKIALAINSIPQGATIFINEKHPVSGVTPFVTKFRPRGKCQTTNSMTARWASGATTILPALRLCWKQGKQQMYTFMRPADAPNGEMDLAVGNQRMTALQAEYEAGQRAAEVQAARRATQAAAEQATRRLLRGGGRKVTARFGDHARRGAVHYQAMG